MYMRIVWGRIVPGKWNEFETEFKSAMARRGDVMGLKQHWLARDQQLLAHFGKVWHFYQRR